MQATGELSEAAKIAYQAFLDMSRSKAAHFNYLRAIDSSYQAGGTASPEENAELEDLLANHDKNVLAFKTALSAVTDSDELSTLIKLMS